VTTWIDVLFVLAGCLAFFLLLVTVKWVGCRNVPKMEKTSKKPSVFGEDTPVAQEHRISVLLTNVRAYIELDDGSEIEKTYSASDEYMSRLERTLIRARYGLCDLEGYTSDTCSVLSDAEKEFQESQFLEIGETMLPMSRVRQVKFVILSTWRTVVITNDFKTATWED
jgi:hypothetical protein